MALSVIIPVYNEGALVNNAEILSKYLYATRFVDDFEILICDNGSTDDTAKVAKSLSAKNKKIRLLSVKEKGLGLGIKKGIENSRFDLCFFYAIDLPFGTEIIQDSLKPILNNSADIVIGSKEHKASKRIRYDMKRLLFSRTYNMLINLFFGLKIKDTQGSLMFRKIQILKFIEMLDSKDAFFQTQILINSKKSGLRIAEVKVNYEYPRKKGSKISVIKDGISMFSQILREYKRQGRR